MVGTLVQAMRSMCGFDDGGCRRAYLLGCSRRAVLLRRLPTWVVEVPSRRGTMSECRIGPGFGRSHDR